MTHTLTSSINSSLSTPLDTAGSVFCMTVDNAHSHDHSSQHSSVSTIATYIDEITLKNRLNSKHRPIHKFKSKPKPAQWTKAEVSQMVKLMKQYGCDFTLIATQMTTKTRDQIKRKFKVLEKSYPHLAEAIFDSNVTE